MSLSRRRRARLASEIIAEANVPYPVPSIDSVIKTLASAQACHEQAVILHGIWVDPDMVGVGCGLLEVGNFG